MALLWQYLKAKAKENKKNKLNTNKMKRIFTIGVAVAMIVMSITSCVENSDKYKNLQSQLTSMNTAYDSLKSQNTNLQASYDEVIKIINELEKSFAQIREQENSLKIEVAENENVENANARIIAKINQIQELLKKNKSSINSLQRQLKKLGKENDALAESILSYEQQLKEKVDMILELQSTIEAKNQSIKDLNTSIDTLTRISGELKESIRQQSEKIHTVFYIVGTSKELKANNIIKSSFSKKALEQEFDKSVFTAADMRELTKIEVNGKRVKILTTHPADSYTIEKNEDGSKYINITDTEKFWSISKYLVIKK